MWWPWQCGHSRRSFSAFSKPQSRQRLRLWFTELARRIKEETGKTIWCWTGFTLEEIEADAHLAQMLPWLDVLVDGPFILEQRDTELLFRGSPNQRIIYLHEKPEDDYIPGTVPLEPLR